MVPVSFNSNATGTTNGLGTASLPKPLFFVDHCLSVCPFVVILLVIVLSVLLWCLQTYLILFIYFLILYRDNFLRAFHIPPDFDDTFINIGLGSLLKESNEPSLYNEWAKTNSNVTSAFVALKKYAYRPYSSDRNQNSIDPRTYFFLREFISNSDDSLALVPTWVCI